ncbi:MAG: sulfotransferase [Candidatus Thermoplasmatota archaeon]|nr:sulfotransferase [Candidatus Thermoplasmatota archaeon]MDD5778531.1 sulfotransferase [Candidatus Thermoplasmatota archaeon]
MKINPFEVTFTPLAGSTFTNLLRLLAQNRFRIGLVGLPRIAYSVLMSLLLSPFNAYETIRFRRDIETTRIEKPPLFIIGHWRSGTTYLHNLLSHDPRFCYPTTFQTVTPGLFLRFEKLIKPLVAASLPPTRPEDNVPLGADLPQEEEYAMGNLSPYSFYNGWCFPRNMRFYHRFVCMDGVSPRQIEGWKRAYLYFLKKVTLACGGKRLLVKNPANTPRIKHLLEMFPDARFVHIYRNPYHTFLSMKRNIEMEMTLYCVQRPYSERVNEQMMVRLYNHMFDIFFRDRELIPRGNLVEVSYEDLVANPLLVVRHIYEVLNLPGFHQVEPVLEKFVRAQSSVKPHRYVIDERLQAHIYSQLRSTIDRWGYSAKAEDAETDVVTRNSLPG